MKRAVIIATGQSPDMEALCARHPVPMLPLLDRPFIQHVIEFLSFRGILDFDIVLSHQPERIEELLGDGTRWGGSIRYHLARDPARPYKMLRIMRFEPGEPVLFGHADRLPRIDLRTVDDESQNAAVISFLGRKPDAPEDEPKWTGWARATGEILASVPADSLETDVEAYFRSLQNHSTALVDGLLCIRSYADLLEVNRTALRKEFEGLMMTDREADEGIWLSRNVILHPTARLIAPVHIAENCRIDAGVRLGPNVVLSSGCLLDSRSVIADSIILSGSYIGEGLELDHCIVDKNRLINVRLGAAVYVTDDFILGNIQENHLGRAFASFFSRILGVLLLVLTWPLLLLTVLYLRLERGSKSAWSSQEVVRLPADTDEASWHTFRFWTFLPDNASGTGDRCAKHNLSDFFLRFLPGTLAVVRGHLSLVGVPPRTREQIRALPEDWRTLYLSSPAGLVTESFVRYGFASSEEERYSAETVYAATAGLGYDAKLFLGYFIRLLGLSPGASTLTADVALAAVDEEISAKSED